MIPAPVKVEFRGWSADAGWKSHEVSGRSRVLANWAADRAKTRTLRREFSAAQTGRLVSQWSSTPTSINHDLRYALPVMRARSRELEQNNDYAKRFFALVANHVVGPDGFSLQMRVPSSVGGATDDAANRLIEAAWLQFCKAKNCDVLGRRSFRSLCKLVIKTIARDGEVLVRRVIDKRLPHGFAMQVLEVDRLEERLNGQAPNGNRMIMGVEIDDIGRPVAYHLRNRHPGDNLLVTVSAENDRYERVPASDVWHLYMDDRPEQYRGLPWMHAAMYRLRQLGAFEEAAVIAARIGASKMGFFKSPGGDLSDVADGTDAEGELVHDADPGTFAQLPPGYDFQQYDPQYPHQHYDAFIKATLRGIASGLGVSYHTIANDLEGVNFSSIRSGELESREQWKGLQAWFVDSFIEPVFETWLSAALLKQQLGFLTAASTDRYLLGANFYGRRWAWVDPLKDIEAAQKAVETGIKSRRQIADEQGVDWDDAIAQIQSENATLEGANIDPYMWVKKAPTPSANTEPPLP